MDMSRKEKIGLIVFALIVLCISSIKFYSKNDSNEFTVYKSDNSQPHTIKVYICGEVKNPGVYKIESDKRIVDLVEMAGGITENADINNINLALKLKDEDYIKIPSKNLNNINNNQSDTKININTATVEELKKLPRVGDAIAKRIIEYREKYGRFKRIEDIKNVSGIGDKMFENIKDLICVYW